MQLHVLLEVNIDVLQHHILFTDSDRSVGSPSPALSMFFYRLRWCQLVLVRYQVFDTD